MSKAFTRESDDLPEQPVTRPLPSASGKDYLTPDGVRRLRAELDELVKSSRDAENKRAVLVRQILANAEISPPPPQPWEQVLFGAIVTVRDAAGVESQYRIVGREETDSDRNWVSWTSPIAKALLKTRLGQRVTFKIPAGEQQWEIVKIEYPQAGAKGR